MELENSPEVATQPTTVEARTFAPSSADTDYADRLKQMDSLLASSSTASPDVSSILMGFNLSNPDHDAPNGPSESGDNGHRDLLPVPANVPGGGGAQGKDAGGRNTVGESDRPQTSVPEVADTSDLASLLRETLGQFNRHSDRRTGRDSGDKNGFHFAVNPKTGKIDLVSDFQTLEYRNDRDAPSGNGSHHAVDRNTGKIGLTPDTQTLDYRPFDRDAWTTRGSHHAVNPKTGKIELTPNVQLL